MYLRLPAAAACPILGGAMPTVFCRVLGPVRTPAAGAAAPAELLWPKHVALLVYLARSPRRSRPREHLVGLLWSDRDARQARHSLSEALRVLRRALGDERLVADVDQVRLAPDAVALDCDRFAELCQRSEWTSAAGLVDGEFLEGLAIPEASDFENWLAAERALWRAQALDALVQGVAADLARGDAGSAARVGLRAVALDRTSEPAARAAMRALSLAGDRAAALRVADELAHALHDMLGTAVSVATARAVPAEQKAEWSALAGLLAGGLGDAPGLAGAPPGALAGLAVLDGDLGARFRASAPAVPVGEALGEVVHAIAAEQPLVIALDDVQWSDRATLATLPALARDTAARPVLLLLGLSRGSPESERLDELRARLGRDLEGAVVRLGRFDAAALRELVRWALPRYDADDAERLTRRVERDTGGLPLLAVAMLEAVVAGFTPPTEAPAWPSRQRTLVDSLPSDLPPAVIGGICLRFRALPAPAQHVF